MLYHVLPSYTGITVWKRWDLFHHIAEEIYVNMKEVYVLFGYPKLWESQRALLNLLLNIVPTVKHGGGNMV